MGEIAKTSAFKSGNGVAVRLPEGLGVKPGDEFELVKNGARIELRPLTNPDPERDRAALAELVRRLHALGPRESPVPRDPIEFPDRPGLY